MPGRWNEVPSRKLGMRKRKGCRRDKRHSIVSAGRGVGSESYRPTTTTGRKIAPAVSPQKIFAVNVSSL